MRSRYIFLVSVFVFTTLLWTVYLFSLQFFNPFHLSKEMFVRYTPPIDILYPNRGSIYDANGDLLVSTVTYYQVDLHRWSLENWGKKKDLTRQQVYVKISKIFESKCGMPAEAVMKRLNLNKDLTSVQISNKIREMDLVKLVNYFEDNKIDGLKYTLSSMKRVYSQGILAARLIGSVKAASEGVNPDTGNKDVYVLRGICGLESTYNKLLGGSYGWREVVRNAKGKPVPYPDLHEKPSCDGYNLRLTIDSKIQEVVENALYDGIKSYSAKNGGAVVMDPNTGKILALAGVSAEDRSIDPGLVRVKGNIPASFLFEPGSTMKPLTMLAALENHVVRPDELIPCGVGFFGIRKISDTHQYGSLQPVDIISKSSNVGIAHLAERVGSNKLYERFISLGYGQRTALNLFGESSGFFPRLDQWDTVYTLPSVSFGQQLSVTALQHITAFCAIANGGKLMKPYLLDSVTDNSGKVIEQYEPEVVRQICNKAVTDTLRYYMQEVVERGTARHIKLDYITLAGKTGTAQKAMEGGHGYDPSKYVSVFVGMFPADAPKLCLIVFYDEPAIGLHYGSTSAAPTFRRIAEDILFMPTCNILSQDVKMTQNTVYMPDLRGLQIGQAENILSNRGFAYKIEGSDSSSVVTDQFPKPGVSVDRSYAVTVRTGKSSQGSSNSLVRGLMPDLCGLTLRKALQMAALENISLKILGTGVVRKQSVQAGSRITKNTVCILEASI
jgi:cell division protein FtsI/penicillin-binding protein 2